MKRIANPFSELVSFDNLYGAWQKAWRGAGKSSQSLDFNFNLENELLLLCDELKKELYQPGGYYYFTIHEPKKRLIAEAPFRDRVVHHAIVNVLEPIYERMFISDSYATRKNKGTHRAVYRAQQFLRSNRWYLKADIKKYFASIDLDILMSILCRKIKDTKLLGLIERILLCDTRYSGLPIGNLTSQFLANVYLDRFDHWIKDELGIKAYVRYMDDFVIFAENRDSLKTLLPRTEVYLEHELALNLKEKSVCINRRAHGLSFLGTRIFPNLIRIRSENLKRSLNRLKKVETEHSKGLLTEDQLRSSGQSIIAHLSSYQTGELRRKIFSG
jgi:RNA-directed DNA polymerase